MIYMKPTMVTYILYYLLDWMIWDDLQPAPQGHLQSSVLECYYLYHSLDWSRYYCFSLVMTWSLILSAGRRASMSMAASYLYLEMFYDLEEENQKIMQWAHDHL